MLLLKLLVIDQSKGDILVIPYNTKHMKKSNCPHLELSDSYIHYTFLMGRLELCRKWG